MQNIKGLVKPTLLITFFSFLGITISFCSQLIIGYYFGATAERDAYFVAITIPTYLSAIFIGSVGIIFLPKIVSILNNKPSESINFLSSIFWMLTLILLSFSVIGILFSSSIIKSVSPGYDVQQNALTSKILMLLMPTCIISVLSNFLSSLYQIQNNFLRPALSSIITSVISLFFIILLSNKIGIFGLAVGYLVGSIISFIFLLPILKTYKLRLYINLNSSEIRSFLRTLFPLFLTGILFRSTSLFERMIASGLPTGSISYLGYTGQILAILATITSSGIAVSFYPMFSKMWSENRMSELIPFFNKIFRVILLISLPIFFFFILFGEILVKIIFERGAFTSSVSIAVSIALAWSMGAFVFQNLGSVVSKVFYVTGKTSVISIIASLEILIYISLGFFLSKYISFIGLSISLSISSMFNILLSLILINKKIFKISFNYLLFDFLKILSISAISFISIYYLYHLMRIENNLYLAFFLIIGMINYFFLGIVFKINEILYLKSKLLILTSKLKMIIYNGRN
jgi:putative peptidoglycan lipid II flippase